MFWDFEKNVKTYVEFQRPLNHSGPKVSSGKSTTSNIVSDVVEKNIDLSSKSNPLCRRRKNYDAST